MSPNGNRNLVTATQLSSETGASVIIDVRKPMARATSGMQIPGAVWRHPFNAANWVSEFEGKAVTVYCVHGHEVSRSVCGFLRDCGVDARMLEGGFEAWRIAGLPTEEAGGRDAE